MTEGYPTRRLGEITENLDSKRRPVKASERRAGPYPYYGAQGIVDRVDAYLFDGEFVLVAEDGENLRSRKEPVALMANGKFWVNNHAHILRGNLNADTRFLFYAINALDISGYVTGSTIPKLSQGNLNRIEVPCPPLHEQRSIASILGCLDDKIDLNRRINTTLEEIARAIFKDWFVDFGPTRAKIEDRTPYLAPNIWELFPDELDDEGKPEGWSSSRLGEFFRLERGLSYKGEFLTKTGTPMINLGCFQGGGFFDAQKIKPYSGEVRPRHKVHVGEMVLANTDMTQKRVVLGSPHVISENDGSDLIYSHHVYAARALGADARQWTRFFYFHLLRPEFRERAEGFATGTTVLFLPHDAAENCTFVLPPEKVNGAFLEVGEPIWQACDANERENRTLVATRDLLLSKLMSGEIRLKDAEKIAEAAL